MYKETLPWVVNYDAAEKLLYNGGYQIYSCMDTGIQQIVDDLYSNPDLMPKGGRYEQQFQSAIVIMNPYDGRILALCGGVGEKTINFGLNRAVPISSGGVNYGGATRSPGSSIKPLASYGPALNEGLITPDTLVNDSANIVLAGTSWYPHNDNYENYGVLSIYQALKWSLNTVAAQVVDKLPNGPQTSYDYLTQRLGFFAAVKRAQIFRYQPRAGRPLSVTVQVKVQPHVIAVRLEMLKERALFGSG